MPKMSYREDEWQRFSTMVAGHIGNYTVPQYGDSPGDEVDSWESSDCVTAISKYVARFNRGRRGRLETLRDLVKIAHFACLAASKMSPQEEEIDKILEGRT